MSLLEINFRVRRKRIWHFIYVCTGWIFTATSEVSDKRKPIQRFRAFNVRLLFILLLKHKNERLYDRQQFIRLFVRKIEKVRIYLLVAWVVYGRVIFVKPIEFEVFKRMIKRRKPVLIGWDVYKISEGYLNSLTIVFVVPLSQPPQLGLHIIRVTWKPTNI